MVGNWLYGVAHQTALKARATAAKQSARERQVVDMPDPADEEKDHPCDWQVILDQELSRLPDKYRVGIVLCDLEGKTRKEAAQQLGLPEGTLAGRLTRGRALLAKRLARNGLAVSGGALATALAQQAASGAVPTSVMASTIKVVTMYSAGQAAAGLISAKVVALTEGVVKAMFLAKLKMMTVLLVMLGVVAFGGGQLLTHDSEAAQHSQAPNLATDQKDGEKPINSNRDFPLKATEGERVVVPANQSEEKKLQGTWRLVTGFYGKYPHVPGITSGENIKNTNIIIEGSGWTGWTPDGKKQKVAFRVDASETLDIKDQEFAYGLSVFGLRPDAVKTPKRIDIKEIGGDFVPGIYGLNCDDLVVRLSSSGKQGRPKQFALGIEDGVLLLYKRIEPQKAPAVKDDKKPTAEKPAEPAAQQEKDKEKQGFTAWGKEVGGLQAGLGFRPGEHRAYRHGETVTLVVRVRNVGKETVKFKYIRQFLDENPPTVTDADGKKIPQHRTSILGIHGPVVVSLQPGQENVLESRLSGAASLKYELRPTSGGGKPTTENQPLFVGTGKVSLQCERVIGNSSSGRMELDPVLSKLATGKLELEIESDPPAAIEKKAPQKQEPGDQTAKKFWAGMSVNQPLFRAGHDTNLLQFHFALVNESDKVIDPKIPGYPRLIVNGKELDLSSIPGTGPRDERFKALPPGDNLQFGMGAGRHFDKPGVYRVYWQGEEFRSNEVVFRVMK
jgi:hypothetical protein